MCNGPILGKIIRFAVPLMLSGMLQLLFNAADVVVVGQFCGSTSLAAVGSNGAIINLLVNVFLGVSVGTNVLVARYCGRQQHDGVFRAVHSSILFSILIGIFIGLLGALLAPQMLLLISVPDDVLPLASLYLRVYFTGIPATVVYNFGAAILRAVGDTRHPLYFLTAAGALNLVCNVFFVVVCHWDVAGVAAASSLSQYLAAFLVLRCLMKKNTSCRLSLKALRIYRTEMLEMIRIGIPAGLQSTMFSISNLLIQSSINAFGSTVIAGNSAAGNLESFVSIAMNAIHHAGVSFISQNLGANKPERVPRITAICLSLVAGIGLVMGNCVYLLGRPLLSIFSPESEVIDAGMIRLRIVGSFYFFCGLMDVCCGIVRGLGRSWLPMIVSMLGACALRIIWIYTIFTVYPTLECLYLSYPISWALTFLAHLITVILLIRRLKPREHRPVQQMPEFIPPHTSRPEATQTGDAPAAAEEPQRKESES